MSLRVLVVDDSVLYRTIVSEALKSIPGVELAGTASNGRSALVKIADLRPDLVTLDIEMPEMNGFQVLDSMRTAGVDIGVIIVSSTTSSGSIHTVKALEKGAFDFITKPDSESTDASRKVIAEALTPRIRAFERRQKIKSILRGLPVSFERVPSGASGVDAVPALDGISKSIQQSAGIKRPEIVLIGVSTGGPVALGELLPAFPEGFEAPICIVQHMPPMFTKALAESLNEKCKIHVKEVCAAEAVRPGMAYIAPGGRQMRFEAGPDKSSWPVLAVTDDPSENNCRPSVDYLFRSAAHVIPGRSMAVILTGMGNDGTMGVRLLRRHGCFTIAQDESSCIVYGMPRSAVEAGVADEILPLDKIARRIVDAVRNGVS